MKIIIKLFFIIIMVSWLFLFSLPAFAETDVWGSREGGSAETFACTTTLGSSDLRTVIGNAIRIILGFLGIIAVVGIVAGGFIMMTAGGSEDKVGTGKKAIVAGVIGLVVVLFAYAIATFVLNQIAAAA